MPSQVSWRRAQSLDVEINGMTFRLYSSLIAPRPFCSVVFNTVIWVEGGATTDWPTLH